MDAEVIKYALTAFASLLVIVDPFGMVPIFLGLTTAMDAAQRRLTLIRAITYAFCVAIFFLLLGRAILTYLGVTAPAFAISGGILLFGTAMPMLFGKRAKLQGTEESEHPSPGEDVAVFPLAIPLLSGPGMMTTLLLLSGPPHSSMLHHLILALMIAVIFGITFCSLWFGDRIMRKMGESGLHVMTRLMGIVLAAVAVQYVLNGITSYLQHSHLI